MKVNQMIEQIKDQGLYELNHPTMVGILPNDGKIIDGFPQAILTFDEKEFIFYTFKGIIKFRFEGVFYKFRYEDITEIEMGKYNFKDRYIKIVFKDEKFIAFQYFLKYKNYPNQKENIERFIKTLEDLAKKDENKEISE